MSQPKSEGGKLLLPDTLSISKEDYESVGPGDDFVDALYEAFMQPLEVNDASTQGSAEPDERPR